MDKLSILILTTAPLLGLQLPFGFKPVFDFSSRFTPSSLVEFVRALSDTLRCHFPG
jgi:hypothetical protein